MASRAWRAANIRQRDRSLRRAVEVLPLSAAPQITSTPNRFWLMSGSCSAVAVTLGSVFNLIPPAAFVNLRRR